VPQRTDRAFAPAYSDGKQGEHLAQGTNQKASAKAPSPLTADARQSRLIFFVKAASFFSDVSFLCENTNETRGKPYEYKT
jgi:hypothetical protein